MNKNIKLIFFVLICLLQYDETEAKIYSKVDSDGTVIYYTKSKRKSSKINLKNKKTKFDNIINTIAKRQDVDPYLIKCIIKVESDFFPNAVSDSGAMGLMQLMQETAEIYDVKDVFDPEENITAGVRHFKGLLKSLNGEIPLALAAYHAGLSRVIKKRKIPDITSTRAYVKKIMLLYKGKYTENRKIYRKIEKDGTIVFYSK